MIDDAEEEGEGMGILAMLGGEDSEDEAVEDSPKRTALADFFSAGKSGDMAAAEGAFQRLYDLCAAKSAAPEADAGELEEF